jgi:hypothetical protein
METRLLVEGNEIRMEKGRGRRGAVDGEEK